MWAWVVYLTALKDAGGGDGGGSCRVSTVGMLAGVWTLV